MTLQRAYCWYPGVVKDNRLLDKVQVGEQVKFVGTHDVGKMAITEIEAAQQGMRDQASGSVCAA